MIQRKDAPIVIAVVVFIMLLGGYYQQLSLEARTWMLPLGIFAVMGLVLARLKQLEYEIRAAHISAYEIVAQEVNLADSEGNERISLSSDVAALRFYDQDHVSRAILELAQGEPTLKLVGDKGSAELTFTEDGRPRLIFRDEVETIIWSTP